jgi:hypothetical protein
LTVAEALERHGRVVVRVGSSSMQPTLVLGESVTVERRAPSAGEVALLDTPGVPTLHRLIARVGRRWVHAGDARHAEAGLAFDEQILGVAELPAELPPLGRRLRLIGSALMRAARHRIKMN